MKITISKAVFALSLLLLATQNVEAQRRVKKDRKKAKQERLDKKLSPSIDYQTPYKNPTEVKPIDDNLYVELPAVKREFRGAWIATVANINWPSKRNLSTNEQKAEAIKLLDLLKDANFNAVIFQARPSADALYKSELEPWSYFLTGEIGKAPSPHYDPLEFWVEEAHKRGMELHVWINPYRAHHSSGGSVSSQSLVHKMPENILRLKNGMYWFDPSHPKTQDHVSKVVRDIVKRYDIDAIHFDDYFYPYASYNGGNDFPDQKTWNEYKDKGGKLSRADWRRENVNLIIKRLHREIKEEKSYVKFGISPFGIWKPGYPNGITGLSQYDELYADAKLWLNEGWVDYFAPQLYWPMNSKGQNFSKLLQWWQSENTQKRHLWPGLNTVEVKAENRSVEICNQINAACELLKDSQGVIHWSIAGLTNNSSMIHSLKNGPYKEKALIPKSPWMKALPLAKPKLSLTIESSMVVADWKPTVDQFVFQWVVYTQYDTEWETQIVNKSTTNQTFPKTKNGKTLKTIAIKAIDRLGNESDYFAKKV
jgi:uncharacterized lipoprotein YddW (UPF0748 family)